MWWQIDADKSSLTTQITYEVANGRLFSLPVALPHNWEVEQVETLPADLLQSWTLLAEKGRPTLTVDLRRPLDAASGARLTVQARPIAQAKVPAAGLTLPIPDLQPVGARTREGALAISVVSLYQTKTNASLPALPLEAAEPRDAEPGPPRPRDSAAPRYPWGKQALDYYFPFQSQGVEGTLVLRPRAVQMRARCASDVVIASGRAMAVVRLDLSPEVGTPQSLDVFVFGSAVAGWEWKTVRGSNPVADVQRLLAAELFPGFAALAARHPLQGLIGAVAPVRGNWWRLSLARPLTEPITLEATIELADQSPPGEPLPQLAILGGDRPLLALVSTVAGQHLADPAGRRRHWDVPLVTIPGVERFDGQLTLHLAGVDLVHVEAQGLQAVNGEPRPATTPPLALTPSSSWRTFRYGHPPISLTVHGAAPAADRSTEAVADHAHLTTYLGPDGRLLHRFRFHIWNWRQQTVPVRLPNGVQLQAAKTDGRWLSRLPPGQAADGSTVFELPVIPGPILHRFELIYSSDVPGWRLWTTLDAPAPVLPLQHTVAFRRTWRLPQGIAPLWESSLVRLPTSVDDGTAPASGFHPTFLSGSADWAVQQEQSLSSAIATVRKQHHAGEDWSLGKLLERLVFDGFKDQPLVVDAQAFRAAGLKPATPLGPKAWEPGESATGLAAPWEALSIGYVPSRPAALLTTRARLAVWQMTAANEALVHGRLEEAVAEAAAFGHDSSGRFRTVPDWLQVYDQGEPAALQPNPAPDIWNPLGTGWTEWEPLAGGDSRNTLLVIHQDSVPLTGLVIAAVCMLAALRFFPHSERRRRQVVLLWLALGGLAYLWVPVPLRALAWPTALAGILMALVWELRGLRSKPVARAAPLASAAAALLAVTMLSGQVLAPAAPTIVYLVPDVSGKAEQRVLAPPALLQQLQSLELRGASGLRGAVLLGAVYEGRAENLSCSFRGTFQAYSFSDDTTTLTLPLAGVQLTDALLDGAPAFPRAQRQPRESYGLRVQGRGLHTVVLNFTVPLPGTVDERELRFGIPELPQSRLTLRVPKASGYLYAAEVRGAQHVTEDAGALKLEADLGASKSLAARWHKEEATPTPAAVEVKEAYYWNLQAATARLLVVLQYTVSKGWQKTFKLDLPNELDVQGVEAGPVPDGPVAPRLKQWLIAQQNGGRVLELEFQGPVTHSVQVTMDLVPRQPFGRTAVLPFLTPRDAKPAPQGFLAYRTEGLRAALAQYHAITGIDKPAELTEAFAKSMASPWRQARQEDLGQPTRAFWRAKGGLLTLTLTAPAVDARCSHDVSWRLGGRQAALHATAHLTSSSPSLSLVEWEVPAALSVSEVSGAEVHYWTRAGTKVQAWLQRPVADTTLHLIGWLPRSPKEATQFRLPSLRVADVPKQSSMVRLSCGDDLLVRPGKLDRLTSRPELGTPGREWVFEADQDSYGGIFETSAAIASADFRLLTFAEVRDRDLVVVATLQSDIRQGELRGLTVTLRNWDGGEVTLNAGEISRRIDKRQGATGRSWVLDLKPGVTQHYQITLTGKIPLGAAPAVFLPEIRVDTPGAGPVRLQHWVALAGSDLAAEGISGLVSVADPSKDLEPWAGEADRLRKAGGAVWKVSGDDWRLRLRPRLPAPRTGAVQAFLSEHSASVISERRWLHQAMYWLHHDAGADLSTALPPNAVLLGLAIDGVSVPPLQAADDRLWLSLPGGAGVRRVRLCWTYPDGHEAFAAPILTGPKLDGVSEGPALWVVSIPAGYLGSMRSGAPQAPGAAALSATELDLARAEAQMRLLSVLVDRGRERDEPAIAAALATAQERFERLCRRAEYQLGVSSAAFSGSASAGKGPAARLQELREQAAELARTPVFARLAADAKGAASRTADGAAKTLAQTSWMVSPLEQGRPLYWQAPVQATPLLQLAPDESGRTWRTLTWSALLLVLLLASWLTWRTFGAAAWPEQLAIVGGCGILLSGAGLALAFVLLPASCIGVRGLQAGQWARLHWPRRKLPAPEPGSSVGSHPPAHTGDVAGS